MGLAIRTWLHAEGWDGPGWDSSIVRRFERLMLAASSKPKGRPALVTAWDDGRDKMPWYQAHAGAEEVELRDRCRELFGVREREPDFADTWVLPSMVANQWKARG